MASPQSNIAYGQIPPAPEGCSILLFPPSCLNPGYTLASSLQAQMTCWPQSTACINSARKSVNTKTPNKWICIKFLWSLMTYMKSDHSWLLKVWPLHIPGKGVAFLYILHIGSLSFMVLPHPCRIKLLISADVAMQSSLENKKSLPVFRMLM